MKQTDALLRNLLFTPQQTVQTCQCSKSSESGISVWSTYIEGWGVSRGSFFTLLCDQKAPHSSLDSSTPSTAGGCDVTGTRAPHIPYLRS